jgi:hypothetical protein
MTEETLVAVYDTPHEADAAIHDLKVHGVPPSAITLHAKGDLSGQASPGVTPPPEQHFLPRMFGYEPTPQDEHDQLVYEHSLEAGSSVVVVHGVPPSKIDVTTILERHNPIDIDERGLERGVVRTTEMPASGTKVRRYVVKSPTEE